MPRNWYVNRFCRTQIEFETGPMIAGCGNKHVG